MDTELHRARWLTAHFYQLQGLRIVPVGLFFLVAGLGYLPWTPWIDYIGEKSDWGYGEDLFIAILVLLYGAIHKFYRSFFGRVVPGVLVPWWLIGLNVGAIIGALFIMTIVDIPVNVFLFIVGVGIGLKGFDGSKRRGPLVLGTIVVLFSFWELLFGTNWLLFRQVFMPTMGLGFIGMGVLDHIRFVQLMKPDSTTAA